MLNDKECLVCKTIYGLHSHHIFGGRNRKLSEKYGLKVWLCGWHHNLSDEGVHFDNKLDNTIKQLGQRKFEAEHGHDEWMKVFGRNYLD